MRRYLMYLEGITYFFFGLSLIGVPIALGEKHIIFGFLYFLFGMPFGMVWGDKMNSREWK